MRLERTDTTESPRAQAAPSPVSLSLVAFFVLAGLGLVTLIAVFAVAAVAGPHLMHLAHFQVSHLIQLAQLQVAQFGSSASHGMLASSQPPQMPCPAGTGSSCLD